MDHSHILLEAWLSYFILGEIVHVTVGYYIESLSNVKPTDMVRASREGDANPQPTRL